MENNGTERKNISSKLLFVLNIVLIVLIITLFFVVYFKKIQKDRTLEQNSFVETAKIENVNVTARAAYVFDLNTGRVLYKKNELEQLPLASLTKLMMAVTAIELLPRDANIRIKKEFLAEDGDNGLLSEESWKLSNLLDFSLIVSSNDGARSIASVIGSMQLNTKDYELGRKEFIRQMNKKAQELGLSQTYFVNESGLDVGSISGGYGTAIDVANLIGYIIRNNPEILEATKYEKILVSSEDKDHIAKNTNKEVTGIPGLLASKTGFTDLAGGNLAVVFDASMGRPIVVVVLGSTLEGRFSDVETLAKAGLDIISK
ncbi:MAG: serine hydrolase [Minisyncoccia bacterium]